MWTVLFRLWVIGAVIWIGLAFFACSYDSRPNAFAIYFWPAVVPPGFLLALGGAVRWTFTPRS
jgi:hypothetical protein